MSSVMYEILGVKPSLAHSQSRWLRQRSQPAIQAESRRSPSVSSLTSRQQVDRVVEQVVQADVVGLGSHLVVAEHERDIDLPGPQQLERLEPGACP